jgi:glycosyltransferase involved in cell wall biosynthesis
MRIGLDVSMLGHGGGIGIYAEQLLAALSRRGEHSLVLWCGSRKARPRVRRLVPRDAQLLEPGFAGRMIGRLGLHAVANPLSVERLFGPVDVLHGPNYLLPSHRGRAARVVTVHDLSVISHPEWHPRTRVWLYGLPLRRTIQGVHHVITDAEAVRAELIERFGVAPHRVTAVPLAPAAVFQPRPAESLRGTLDRYGLSPGEYVLFAGALEPRKNVDRLLKAMDLLRQRRRGVPPLVLVGPPGWRNDSVIARATSLPRDVRLLGAIARDEVAALMAGALVFVFPSLEEGFGLPVLEAMACGTLVVTTRAAVLAEVAGDAAVLVTATDVDDIAAGLERAIFDSQTRTELSRRGLARAAAFSWERTAARTLEVYERAVASR